MTVEFGNRGEFDWIRQINFNVLNQLKEGNFQRKDANFLVEEFMLLANMEVARRLHNYFKGKALLRRHPPPKKKELNLLVN
jgi:DIS3-like exonuclease 2